MKKPDLKTLRTWLENSEDLNGIVKTYTQHHSAEDPMLTQIRQQTLPQWLKEHVLDGKNPVDLWVNCMIYIDVMIRPEDQEAIMEVFWDVLEKLME
jgi:hypothetical protein